MRPICLLLLLSLAASVRADETYFTLGLTNSALDGRPPAGCTLQDASASGTGGSFGVGYGFGEVLAVEFGYLNLGSLDLTATCPGPTTVKVVEPDSGLTLSGAARWRFARQWSVYGRAGAFSWSKSAQSGTETLLGVGGDWAFDERYGLRLEYDDFGNGLTATTLTLRWNY